MILWSLAHSRLHGKLAYVVLLGCALALIALPSIARADDDDPSGKLDQLVTGITHQYEVIADIEAQLTDARAADVETGCRADPSSTGCGAVKRVCAEGASRDGGRQAKICLDLGWTDPPIDDPFTAVDVAQYREACQIDASSPYCAARGRICYLHDQYGYYLWDSLEAMCESTATPRAHSRPQPGSIAGIGYLQFGSATPSGAMSSGEWGFGIDYRAIPEIFPIGAELDITKANGTWHGRAGFHGGIGFESSIVSGGVLIGFRRGGLVHDGYDLPGELLLFTRLGPLQVQLDAQAGFRFGAGVQKHFIGEGKLLVPIARAHRKGAALFLGVHWATENGEQLASFVIGGGLHQ